MFWRFIILIFAIGLVLLSLARPSQQTGPGKPQNLAMENVPAEQADFLDTKYRGVTLAGETFLVEVAISAEERARGLSGRDMLSKTAGMLFAFERPARHGFWMKDMKFPLDIIWILDDKVVEIWANAPIPRGVDIPRYQPSVEANYVLEVNAGFVDKTGLKIGDEVNID